jgi:hypothetical protein
VQIFLTTDGLLTVASVDILTGTGAKENDECHGKIHDIQAIACL